jgi:tetratricopeptide (TPR) repeat protein
MRRRLLILRGMALAALLAAPRAAPAVEVGEPIDDAMLPALAGGKANLLVRGAVNVLVFSKPGHPHCTETLTDLAAREGKVARVHWVAIMPGDSAPAEVRALVATTGIKMPVLLDPGDALYGKLGVKLQPTILVVDREGKLAAWEPFREINYGDRLMARIRFTLGEISQAQLAEAEDPQRSDTRSEEGAARSHLRLAQRLMEASLFDQALAEVQKSLAVTPTAQAYVLQGKILARQGKCGEAGRAFDVALQLEPKNAEPFTEKSRCSPGSARSP